jgi:hypothetical protein
MPSAVDRELQAQLVQLARQFTEAFKAENWERVGEVDLRIRHCLQAIAELEAPSAELQQTKAQLRELYARVLPSYADACEKMRQLLVSHVDYSEGRSAYLRTDLLQGER